MASPPSPTHDLTRHQLDELDALLQRMLSLPLSAAGPASPGAGAPTTTVPLPANWRADPAPAPPRVPHLAADLGRAVARLSPLPPPVVEAEHIPASQEAVPLFGPPAAEPRTVRGVDASAYTPVDPVTLAPVTSSPAPAPLPAPPPAEDTVPFFAWPVYAANALCEAGLAMAGPPGRVLARPAVKHLLGVAGLLLCAGAVAWAARGPLGW